MKPMPAIHPANHRPPSLPIVLAAIIWSMLAPVHAADLSADYTWKPMKIGGGGWVTGLDIRPTEKDLVYARTDVSGAYRWNATTSSWKQVVTTASMPAGVLAYGKFAGVDSLVGAPKDPRIAYMAYTAKPYGGDAGQIYRSTDRGDTWTATGFLRHQVKMEPNGEGRQEGERLAVDPANSDLVYFGSLSDGLWTTFDAGKNWSRAAAIPAGTPGHGVNTVVFDRASGATQGKTNVIYVTVMENGVFKTNDAGKTWARISDSGPGNAGKPRDAAIGPDRTYYVVYDDKAGATGSVWKYSSAGVWTDITPPAPNGGSKSWWAVAVNSANARQVVAMIQGGRCFVSNDQGATWTDHGFRLKSPVVEWQEKQANYFLSVGELAFDPFQPGTLWFSEGFGVWRARLPAKASDIEWISAGAGIEETCGNDVIAPPGGKPVAAMWDLGAFYFSNPDAYTARKSHPGFMSGWALDWCPADPKFIAGVFRNHLDFGPQPNSSGYSTDGGQTWTRFAALETNTAPADLEYGVIAVSANSPDNIVWCPTKDILPYHTQDRGKTWMRALIDGSTQTGFNSFPMSQKALCADRVLAGTFYFYSCYDGLFRSTDGGANFTPVGTPLANRWNIILKSAPGHAGHLWFAGGADGGGLWRSTDGGVSWTENAGLQQALNVGLGKARAPGGYPTLFVAGIKDGKHGLYRSTDEGKTWDKIGDYPLGLPDLVDAIDGDKDVFGKVYLAFSGAGFAYGTITQP
jgi:photosystem II stability/assembly factor-like uncharacterized protein